MIAFILLEMIFEITFPIQDERVTLVCEVCPNKHNEEVKMYLILN